MTAYVWAISPYGLAGRVGSTAGGQPLEHATQLVDLNNTAPCSGTLTSWRYCHYPITGAVSFQVWPRRGALQLDLVHSQSFPIFSSITAKRSTWRAKRTAFGKPSISEFCHVMFLVRTWIEHSHDDRDPSAISIRFMQRAALQAKLAQGFDHNQDSPQNTGLSRYAYSHWGILIAVLAPLAVLSVPIVGVLLCCKSQSHPNNKCAAIDEGPTSKQSKRIGNWAPLKAVPATSSGSKPGCINLGKDTPLRGNISSNHGGDPPACGVPGASGGESPKVYELLISAGANAHSPLLYEAPVPLPAEPDPLMYEVPASEGAEPTCVKSNERTQPTVLPDDETIQVAGAHEDTFPPLNLLSMETSALNRISCTQEACASSEMELICQLAKEEVMLISATDIQLLSEIGRGLLGSVHRALWHVPHKKPQEVTMIGLGTQKDRITLLQTAVTMGRLEHPNVITTIGIMVEPEHLDHLFLLSQIQVCIVTEYCTNGSLLSYLYALRKRDGIRSVSGIQQLQTFARHIARGMIYLSDKGVIHHGLAAKNVYVSANDTCKIGGIENARLARYDGIVDDSLINWMPVEVLRSSLYSTSSDVWSFGCLLYELWTLGEMPFKGCSPSEDASSFPLLEALRRSTHLGAQPVYHFTMSTSASPSTLSQTLLHDSLASIPLLPPYMRWD
eukprot:Em0043g13a